MEIELKRVTVIILIFVLFQSWNEVESSPLIPINARPHLTLFEHENHQGKRYYQDVGPRCYNLPHAFDGIASSLDTHHKCIKICRLRNCIRCIKMGPGTPGHFALREVKMNDDVSSFTTC